jgi:hypothetical protein
MSGVSGASDGHCLLVRPPRQRCGEFVPGIIIGIAAKFDRSLPDAFDKVENCLPLLPAHRISEDTPQQTNIVSQRQVLVGDGVALERGGSFHAHFNAPASA